MILQKPRKIVRRIPPSKEPETRAGTREPEVDDAVNDLPKKTQSKYNTLRDKEITSIEIFRAPIQSVFKTLLEVATPGLKQLEKKLGYDNLYHLGMIITVKNDRKYIVEKNQNILIIGEKSYPNTEKIKIPLRGKITLGSMFNKALKGMGKDKFYGYNFETNNCQKFISSLLRYSNLLYPEANKFIEQDISTLIENMPSRIKDVANLTTDIASILDRLQQRFL